jgi:hypothetical protein
MRVRQLLWHNLLEAQRQCTLVEQFPHYLMGHWNKIAPHSFAGQVVEIASRGDNDIHSVGSGSSLLQSSFVFAELGPS